MIKQAILFASILLSLSACIGDGMTDTQRKFVNRQKELEKLSDREKLLIEDLENNGYNEVIIDAPDSKNQGKNSDSYILNLKPPFALSASENSNRIAEFSDSIAKIIYSEVMSESAKSSSKKVKIRFTEGVGNDLTILIKDYPLSYLEEITQQHLQK